jgi:hypothetical protein
MKKKSTGKLAANRDTTKARRRKRRLPPDPYGENDKQAARARKLVDVYGGIGNDELETQVQDMLADLMHLCDREPRLGDFEEQLDSAFRHYEDETHAG